MPNNTQTARRAKYGLNVAVAVVAALAIAVLVNVLAARYLTALPPIDLTATGQYSLSPQTRKLLAGLDADYQIITLFAGSANAVEDQRIQRAKDLLDQYGRYSTRLSVEHINPDLQVGRLESFYEQLQSRYAAELQPSRDAIAAAQKDLASLRENMGAQRSAIATASADPALPAGNVKKTFNLAAGLLARRAAELQTAGTQIDKLMEARLPPYGSVVAQLEAFFSQLDGSDYTALSQQFQQFARQNDTPGSVKEALLQLDVSFKQTRESLQKTLVTLRAVTPPAEYERVTNTVQTTANAVLILGPTKVKAINLGEMFRQPPRQAADAGDEAQPELLFQGEEILTGALVSLTLKTPPLVVFVGTGQRSPLGPGGEYEFVARRLRAMEFDVRAWNPGGGSPGPMGQPMPPQPAPSPRAGQAAIWVLLPAEPAGPMNFTASALLSQAVEHLKTRLDAGDGVMFILAADPAARFGQPSPILPELASFGITAQLDRVIMQQVTLPDGKKQPSPTFIINNWPDALPVTKALAGMPAAFSWCSPVTLAEKPGVEQWPLAIIREEGLWAGEDFETFPEVRFNDKNAAASFTVAGAAQRDKTRVIVVASPMWASDYVTSNADRGLRQQGVGLADIFGAAYPGNAEFFVNGVQWLGHLDQLIAASARSQDIRRIGPLSQTTQSVITWSLLAGIPALTILIGLTVAIVRNRG